jgi:hypothetical protein
MRSRNVGVATEIRIEHRYPQARLFMEAHGPHGIAILHDLLIHAQQHDAELVVQASVREIAARLPSLSKDTVHRQLRELHRVHVIRTSPTNPTSRFERPTYVLDLTGTGISVTRSCSAST